MSDDKLIRHTSQMLDDNNDIFYKPGGQHDHVSLAKINDEQKALGNVRVEYDEKTVFWCKPDKVESALNQLRKRNRYGKVSQLLSNKIIFKDGSTKEVILEERGSENDLTDEGSNTTEGGTEFHPEEDDGA